MQPPYCRALMLFVYVLAKGIYAQPPNFTSPSYSVQVQETAAKTVVEGVASPRPPNGFLTVRCMNGSNSSVGITYTIGQVNGFFPFTLNSTTGSFNVTQDLVYATQPHSYNFLVCCHDNLAPNLSSNASVLISVIEVDKYTPVITPSYIFLNVETTPIGTVVASTRRDVGALSVYNATDMDVGPQGVLNFSLYYSDPRFSVDSTFGTLTVQQSLNLTITFITVIIYACDPHVCSNQFSIYINTMTHQNDHYPMFSQKVYSVTYNDSTPPGQMIPSICTDRDIGVGALQGVMFLNPTPGVFLLNSSTGVLTTNITMDYRRAREYTVVLLCRDTGGLTNTSTVYVSITPPPNYNPLGGLCRREANVSSIQGTYSWPDAEPGQSVSQMCQYGNAGQNITRLCNGNLTWTESASRCPTEVSAQVKQLIMLVANQTISDENVVNITTQLSDVISRVTLVVDQSTLNVAAVTNIIKILSNLSSQIEEAVTNVVEVLNSIQQWPPMVLEENGSNIVKSFEIIVTTLVQQTNFVSLTNVTGSQVTFLAEKVQLEPLKSSGRSFNVTTAGNMLIKGNNSSSSVTPTASVLLPSSLFSSINGSEVGIFFSVYTAASFFPLANTSNTTFIASFVLGATVVAEGYAEKKSTADFTNLTDPIQLAFTTPVYINSKYTCVSWNFNAAGGRGNWTSDGCITNTSSTRFGQVLCHCSHLTNFAILVDISVRISDDDMPNKEIQRALEIISYIGVSLSIVGLMLTVIALMMITKLRHKDISKYHIQLCCALIGMLLVFVTGINRTETFEGCVTVSVLIHYFTLVAVMWMGAEALLMFQKLFIVFFHITTRYIIIISLICWLVPLVPVLVPLIINKNFLVKRNSTMGFCFISDTRVFFGAFLGPILLVLFFNALTFVAVAIMLVRHSLKKSKAKVQTLCVQMLSLLGVFILFGLTWIFGTLTVIKADHAFEVVFTVINSLQGFFIFIFFCALNKDVRLALSNIAKRHRVLYPDISTSGSKSNTLTKVHGTKSDTLERSDDCHAYSLKKAHVTEFATISFKSEVISTSVEKF